MARALAFRHIEVIHAVVLTGSVTGAARRLHVTQPAVSNMLRDARERVGFDLFATQAGRLLPLPRTLALFEEIERSFTGLDGINGLVERLRQHSGRAFVVACTPALAATVLPEALAALRDEFPGLLVTVHSRSADYAAALVSSHKADVGLALSVPPIPGVRSEVLAELPMVCYLPAGHRLARRQGAVRAEQLAGEPRIGASQQEGVDAVVARAFADCGGLPPATVECAAALAACAMVGAGLGFTIAVPLPATLLAPRRVAIRRFVPALSLPYCAYWFEAREPREERVRLVALIRERLLALAAQWQR